MATATAEDLGLLRAEMLNQLTEIGNKAVADVQNLKVLIEMMRREMLETKDSLEKVMNELKSENTQKIEEAKNKLEELQKKFETENPLEEAKNRLEELRKEFGVEDSAAGGERKRFRQKEADKFFPDCWGGSKSDKSFMEYRDGLVEYIEVVAPGLDGEQLLNWAANFGPKVAIGTQEIQNKTEETEYDLHELANILGSVIKKTTRDTAKTKAKGAPGNNGFDMWRRVQAWYSPKDTGDQVNAQAEIMFPGTAMNMNELAQKLDKFDADLVRYEAKYNNNDFTDSLKRTIVSSIIPKDLLQTRFKGTHTTSYRDLRDDIDRYLTETIPRVKITLDKMDLNELGSDTKGDKEKSEDKLAEITEALEEMRKEIRGTGREWTKGNGTTAAAGGDGRLSKGGAKGGIHGRPGQHWQGKGGPVNGFGGQHWQGKATAGNAFGPSRKGWPVAGQKGEAKGGGRQRKEALVLLGLWRRRPPPEIMPGGIK